MVAEPTPAVAEFGTPEAQTASVVIRRGRPGSGVLLAFAGIRGGYFGGIAHGPEPHAGTVPTQMAGVLSRFDVTVLFVRDSQDLWWQLGLAGLGDDPPSAAERLRDLIPLGSPVLGTVGASAGGMGAILFGTYLAVPRTVAFSPRTLVTEQALRRQADAATRERIDLSRPWADLRRIVAAGPPRIDIHVGGGNRHDLHQARRLQEYGDVTIVTHPTDDHMCVRWLRQQGELEHLLQDAFGLPVAAPPA